MNTNDVDSDLRDVAERVSLLSKQVQMSSRHKTELGRELLHRHGQIAARRQRAEHDIPWSRLSPFKRVAFLATPTVGLSALCGMIIWMLQLTGQVNPQAAEAARISSDLAHTVPTVTGWQVTVHKDVHNTESLYGYRIPLSAERLSIRSGTAYLYSGGTWYQLSASSPVKLTPSSWQWALASLPAHLQRAGSFAVVRQRTAAGAERRGIRYAVPQSAGVTVIVTAWIARTDGVVIRLEHVVRQHGRVTERDVVDYESQRKP